MNKVSLEIKPIQIEYTINDKVEHTTVAEYYIEGKSLADIFHISRDDLRFSDTDFNILFSPMVNRTPAQVKELIEDSINQFIGKKSPSNQFSSNRLVLYRCHCGADYCGVISCKLQFTDTAVIWSDIAFEIDNEVLPVYKEYNVDVSHVDQYIFDTSQYNNVFSSLKASSFRK